MHIPFIKEHDMHRFSIEIIPEKRIRQSDDKALHEPDEFLQSHIDAAERGEVSTKSIEQIFNEVLHTHCYF